MARTPEPTVNITEGIQPAAQILDTYVRPATTAPSPLHAVADALAPLSHELFGLAAEQQAQQNKAEKAAGEAAFWNQNQDGAAEGVASGKIPADRSPKFMEGYAGMAGLNDGAQINQTIGPDYTKLDKTSTDPAAFDKWFFPYVRSKANPALMNNPAYSHAWGNQVAQLHARLSAQFVTDRSDALKAGAFQSFSGSLGNTMDDQYYGSGGQPDTIKLAQSLNDIRVAAYKSGMEKAQVDKGLVDVIATKAIETKNPALLEALKQIPADPNDPAGVKLGETEYGNATTLKTQQSIQTRLLQDQERQQKETDRKDKEAGNAALTGVLLKWAQDSNYIPSASEIATISKIKPEFVSTMATLRENILKNDTIEDPNAIKTLYDDMYKSGDPQGKIEAAIGKGVLKTGSSIDNAVKFGNLVENYQKSGGAFKITEDPSFKGLEQAIITHTKDPKWAGSMFAEQGLTDAGRQALYDARVSAMEWATTHPNASALDRTKFLFELQEGMMKRIQPGVDLGSATGEFKPKYSPAPGAPSTAVQAPPAAPASPQPTPPPQAPQNNAPAVTPGPAGGQRQGSLIDTPAKAAQALAKLPQPPSVADLPGLGVSPEVVQKINQAAANANMQPQAFINEMYKRAKALGPRGEAAPTEGQPQVTPASFTVPMPGGGRVEVHGVSPEVQAQVTEMVQRMARLGGGTSQQAAQNGDSMRGELSARYESAHAGSGAIAHDSTGGWSYGRYQFASGGSVADGSAVRGFLATLKQRAPELEAKLEAAGGASAAKAGSSEFKAAWKQASADPRFRDAEDEAAYKNLVGPAVAATKRETGLDVNTRSHAVQEVMWSTAIQHGGNGAAHLWRNALKGRDPSTMSDAELIRALYTERSRVGVYFRHSTQSVQQSVKNRFADEERHALAMLQQEGTGTTKVASAE